MTTSPARPWVRDFLLLALIWGSSFLFMRIAAQELGPLPTAALRVTIAALFLWPILRARGHAPLLRQHWKPIFFVGMLNSGIPFALYSFAVMHITTGLSSILNATVPLFGAIVAWLWLGDRPGLSRSLGLALGFAGVALLAGGEASFKPNDSGIAPFWAVLACLGATVCYALSASFTKNTSPACRPWSRPPAARWVPRWPWRCPPCGGTRSTCPACTPGPRFWRWASCAPGWLTSSTSS